jgi:hypothetical protein
MPARHPRGSQRAYAQRQSTGPDHSSFESTGVLESISQVQRRRETRGQPTVTTIDENERMHLPSDSTPFAGCDSRRIGLVGCVKEKTADPRAAKDLYLSPIFSGLHAVGSNEPGSHRFTPTQALWPEAAGSTVSLLTHRLSFMTRKARASAIRSAAIV